jgi:hypothetical protein
MSWSNKDPKWKHDYFNILDFILGKNEYNEVVLEEKNIDIPMPEGKYLANIKITEDTWKRSRWFPLRIKRCKIDVPKGIPHPGKGTMSYNCGDDASYGLCCKASSISEAVGAMVESVYRSRIKYGGYDCLNWKNENKINSEEKSLTPNLKEG